MVALKARALDELNGFTGSTLPLAFLSSDEFVVGDPEIAAFLQNPGDILKVPKR